ncbi:MAG TPA: DUF4157 domain-containing protein [Chloroflexota bacterium]|jgi:hypothetical protein
MNHDWEDRRPPRRPRHEPPSPPAPPDRRRARRLPAWASASGPALPAGLDPAPPTAAGALPPAVRETLNTPGEPLAPAEQARAEEQLRADFHDVRVHADARAAGSADAVGALAYTVGQDVVFAAGQYAPGTAAGQELIAHELTHVVQQGEAAVPALQRQPRSPDEIRARIRQIEDLAASPVITDEYLQQLNEERNQLLAALQQPPEAAPAPVGPTPTPARPAVRVDYPAAADAYHGIQLYYVAIADFPVHGTRSPGVFKSTLYWIAPQVREAEGTAAGYVAYNPQNNRNEWIIGPGEIGAFLAHERMFFGTAQAVLPFGGGEFQPYQVESGRMVARLMAGDVRGGLRAWVAAWSAAFRDPHWWVQAATATAGGAAAAGEAGVAAEAGEAATAGQTGLATRAATSEQFYVQDGVRRAVAAREAGLTDVPATIYRPGQPPTTTRIPLDQLNSPKASIPYDTRFSQGSLRPALQGSPPPPITVEPLGQPGQLPTTPVPQVEITY